MKHKLTREIMDQIKIFEAMGVKIEISNDCVVTIDNEEFSYNEETQGLLAFRIEFFGFVKILVLSPVILEFESGGGSLFTSNVISEVNEIMEEKSVEIVSRIQKQRLSKIAGLKEQTPPQPII